MKKNIKMLYTLLKGNIALYLGAIIAINISALLSVAYPLVLRATIDSVIGKEPVKDNSFSQFFINFAGGKEYLAKNLWIAGIIVVFLTVAQGVFMYLNGRWSASSSEAAGKKLREKVYDHLQHLPYDYHVKAKTGDLIQRCTSDVETVMNFISNQFIDIGQIALKSVYVTAIMFSLNVRYALVSIILLPVILLITLRFFINMQKVFKKADEADGRMSATLQENLTGVRVVKAFGRENHEIEKFDIKNRAHRDSVRQIIKLMSNFWSSTDFLSLMQLATVIVLGIYWASTDVITVGTLVAFMSYIGMLLWPIRQLGQILAGAGQSFVSLGRISEILDTPAEYDDNKGLKPEIHGVIEFENVYFEYEKDKPVLENISFKINKGETIAILGPTGSGKSSLVHLLVKLYDYQKGSIKIDGTELKDMNKKWIRSNVGIVLQEPFLFSKTIKDNIKLGKYDAHDIEVHEASTIAAIHDTILDFDKGYDTIVGERGVTLSGGQKQRVAIARTIINNCPILIFDDSLSAVDMETDAAIRKALNERSKDTTTFIISHRITTLSQADRIFVIENGSISQHGTHEELLNREGLYRRIWDIQGSLEEELDEVI